LIEVGSGFHPELTGRENIFLNGAILGMRRNEIAAKLDSIADFAGIRAFLDVPVKRFSSGMYVRLGFSIAAHLDPDILLLDEVLAVGDAAFQEKCLRRISELREAGKTIVFISHDLAAVERICTRVILMRQGEIVTSVAPADVIAEYQRLPAAPRHNIVQTVVADDSAKIESVELRDLDGRPMPTVQTGAPLAMRISYTVRRPLPDVVFEVVFARTDHEVATQWSTEENGEPIALDPGEGVIEFQCEELGFMPGIYFAAVAIRERGAPEAIDWQWGALTFRVDPGKTVAGMFYMSHRWTLRTLAHRAGD
jgi:ABC-type proline/glycine betaine transport system ATPase subunit